MLIFLFIFFLITYLIKIATPFASKKDPLTVDLAITQVGIVVLGLAIAYGKDITKLSAGKEGVSIELKAEVQKVIADGKAEINASLELVKDVIRAQMNAAISKKYNHGGNPLSICPSQELDYRDALLQCMEKAGLEPDEFSTFKSNFNNHLFAYLYDTIFEQFDEGNKTFGLSHGQLYDIDYLDKDDAMALLSQLETAPYKSTDKQTVSIEQRDRAAYINMIRVMIQIAPDSWLKTGNPSFGD